MLAGVPHVPAVPPQTVVDATPEPVALPTHGAGVQLAARVLGGVGLQVCPSLPENQNMGSESFCRFPNGSLQTKLRFTIIAALVALITMDASMDFPFFNDDC